jgi:hypothetical protein
MTEQETKPVRQYRQNFYGHFTIKNAPEIARLFRELLEGKRFTIVAYFPEKKFARCQVLTSETLKDKGIILSTEPLPDGTPWAHLIISTSWGVWGFSTTEPDREHGLSYDTPYLVFDFNGEVTIHHKAPCGDELSWTFKVEQPT